MTFLQKCDTIKIGNNNIPEKIIFIMEGDSNMVFVVSDFHGNLRGFRALQKAIGEQDIVFMLGDACDRGTHGIQILKEVKEDPRFRYIVGNHDDFILRTYRRELVCSKEHTSYWGKACWNYNTNPSYEAWEKLRKEDPLTFEELVDWLAQCDVFKTVVVNGRVFRLAHAKYPQEMDNICLSMSWKDMEGYNSKLLFSTIWDRYTDEGTDGYTTPGAVSVIGHTPREPEEVVRHDLFNVDGGLGYGSNTVRVFCANTCQVHLINQGDCLMSGPNNLKEISDLRLEGFMEESGKRFHKDIAKAAREINAAVKMPWTPIYKARGIVCDQKHTLHGQNVTTSRVKKVLQVGRFVYLITRNSCYRVI